MIIAVDGPAASGKGTVARAIASHFGLPFLDTGLLYRAVGLAVLRAGGDPASPADALAACDFDNVMLSDPEIRSETASRIASTVSAHHAVRAALLQQQQAFAAQSGGAVLDGRDIGTVIAPHAEVKLFVTASVEARARRRHAELAANGASAPLDQVVAELRARDDRDATRSAAPLARAHDADLLDTTAMSIAAAIDRAIALVEERVKARRA